jgi:hypothetical protein
MTNLLARLVSVSRCGDERHRLAPLDDALPGAPANVFLVLPPKRSLHTPRKLRAHSKVMKIVLVPPKSGNAHETFSF